jgi:hypothetical protein
MAKRNRPNAEIQETKKLAKSCLSNFKGKHRCLDLPLFEELDDIFLISRQDGYCLAEQVLRDISVFMNSKAAKDEFEFSMFLLSLGRYKQELELRLNKSKKFKGKT